MTFHFFFQEILFRLETVKGLNKSFQPLRNWLVWVFESFQSFYSSFLFSPMERKLEQLNSAKKSKEKPRSLINIKMTNILMLLRKCCNHPYLLEYPFNPENNELLIDENLVKVSGKMIVLDQMLPALKARGHKVRKNNYFLDKEIVLKPRFSNNFWLVQI